jgi:predicted dinucleotide-binding enzyme
LIGIIGSGDDREAKDRVARLIEEIGFATADSGTLAEGDRRQQPGSPIYTKLITAREAEEALT